MFSYLSKKFDKICDSIKGISLLDESSMKDFFEIVKSNLLDADVSLIVIDKIINTLKEKCIGIKLSKKITAEEFISKQFKDIVIDLLGGDSYTKKDLIFNLANNIITNKNNSPIIITFSGLQGAGKTTLISKFIYRLLKKSDKKINSNDIAVSSLDYDRPAGRKQLSILAEKFNIESLIYENINNAEDAAKNLVNDIKNKNKKILLVDLAGRTSLDSSMMNELKEVIKILNPNYNFLVMDSMIGQEGLSIAKDFSNVINFYGAIITKVDSEAPGGIILGLTTILNLPIKYISHGEKPDEFDIFNPIRATERLLGMGDIIGLAEIANTKLASEEELVITESIKRGDLNIDEYSSMIKMLNKMGPLKNLISMIPKSMLAGKGMNINSDMLDDMEKFNIKFEHMRTSMNPKERKYPNLILENPSRIERIRKGSGLTKDEIHKILEKYKSMRINMKNFKNQFGMF